MCLASARIGGSLAPRHGLGRTEDGDASIRDCTGSGRSSVRSCSGLSLAVLAMAALLHSAAPASAQSLNDLTGALGGKSGGAALGGMGLPAVDQASTSNLAGVLEYCVKNKYLGGGDAKSVEQGLMGKIGGSGKAASDKGFKAGSGGLLDTGGGESFSLGGDGIQKQVTDQVCDLVLEHAQSML